VIGFERNTQQARGRCERAFGTIQGRLPQELRVEGIRSYEHANEYLDRQFVAEFNRKFTVTPAQAETAFTPLAGIDLKLLLSTQHAPGARIVVAFSDPLRAGFPGARERWRDGVPGGFQGRDGAQDDGAQR
jgi:hypothetical protein